jgi:hypothetical protein
MSIRSLLLTLFLVIALPACTQAPAIKDKPADEFAAEGLHAVSGSGFQSAYVRPGANLPAYRSVNIVGLELGNIDIASTPMSGTLRRDWQMTPQRKASLQQTWAASMQRFFHAYDMTASGDGVLRITAELIRVAPGRPSATTIGGGLQPVGSSQDVIEVTAEFRLYKQDNAQLLAVIRDSRTMTSVALSRTGESSVRSMFNAWSALLHTRISGR